MRQYPSLSINHIFASFQVALFAAALAEPAAKPFYYSPYAATTYTNGYYPAAGVLPYAANYYAAGVHAAVPAHPATVSAINTYGARPAVLTSAGLVKRSADAEPKADPALIAAPYAATYGAAYSPYYATAAATYPYAASTYAAAYSPYYAGNAYYGSYVAPRVLGKRSADAEADPAYLAYSNIAGYPYTTYANTYAATAAYNPYYAGAAYSPYYAAGAYRPAAYYY